MLYAELIEPSACTATAMHPLNFLSEGHSHPTNCTHKVGAYESSSTTLRYSYSFVVIRFSHTRLQTCVRALAEYTMYVRCSEHTEFSLYSYTSPCHRARYTFGVWNKIDASNTAMSRQCNRLALLDSEHKCLNNYELRKPQLRPVALQHGDGHTDHRD